MFTKSSGYCTGVNCYSGNIWAPELNYINGAWYLYFSAGSSDPNTPHQRMWVIRNTSANPLEGTWSAPIKLRDSADYWSIDHTVAHINGQLYISWSEIAPGQPQRIMIAKMSSPTAIQGRGVVISAPTNSWETSGSPVNEAPAFITRGSKVHLTFSASGCWTDDYKLGLLSANITSDLTVAGNWTKSSSPVFQKTSNVFGPGHNSFVKSPDGTEDWIVYHANDGSGQGCGDQRTTRIQKVTWNGDTPVFGTPVNPATAVIRPSGEGTGDIFYRIRNRNSGKYLDLFNGTTTDGTNIVQWTGNTLNNQKWALDPVSGGFFKLRSAVSGKVAAVTNNSTADGANVAQYTSSSSTGQQWSFVKTNNQYFKIVNRNSGKVLDVYNGSLDDGGNVGQWSDLNNTIQQWIFERVN